jgi:hypothetical protein
MGIGHVTPNGTWKGPINSFSEGDVGFHFYPLENWRFPIEY